MRLAKEFGNREAGAAIYDYYVKTGPILPGIQNLVNIYNMNFHPTAISQEATLNGIVTSDRWETVDAPLARPLDDYTLDRYEAMYGQLTSGARERPPLSVKGAVVDGRPGREAVDPIRLGHLLAAMAEEAVRSLESANAGKKKDEYARFLNDARSILHLSRFYEAKLEAAYEKGLYDRSGDVSHLDRMLDLLAKSVEHYARLDATATPAYRQATDLGEWYRWSRTLDGFEAELAFYRKQRAFMQSGADVVFLGLDGPMSDATNVFHWLLHEKIEDRNWSSQSYALGEDFLTRARLAVVYDTHSDVFQENQERLMTWVRRGGRLVIWDPLARAASEKLLEGIFFWSNEIYETRRSVGFSDADHPLLEGLGGRTMSLSGVSDFNSSVRAASDEWRELAYTVLYSKGRSQFYVGHETFGPRWTSLMNPRKVPVILSRQTGQGEIVLMQMGVSAISPKFVLPPDPSLDPVPDHLLALVTNLVQWAKE